MPSNVAPYIDCDNTIIEDEHGTCFGVSSEVAYDLCCDGEVYHIYRANIGTGEIETRSDYTYCPNCGRAYPIDSDYLNAASEQEDSGEITHYCKHCVPKYLR
ncbi:hypothetical protein HPC37_02985 [Pasteurellaceae bacterium 20609_3]|uniref:hypothetical protein n=1 Tax=Spirabiliibacterium mucosae TaxID=28156 RepID=UPI001AADD726|nr:hypothetical protein [Spirabiliibacterium mucosae]MBE2897819.1 hypothetical protein [Spirabiliibacterium mucosae]